VVILGRGGAGKSLLAGQLGKVTGLPVVELDTMFWQPGLIATDPTRWAACQRELIQRDTWILDGDLGPYDSDLKMRLRAADTVIVLDFAFLRCAWQTIRRGRKRSDYWRWIWAYRRRSLPTVMEAITAYASHAEVYVLRNARMVRHFVAQLRQTAA
jgi:adenylate kinase family enzyme